MNSQLTERLGERDQEQMQVAVPVQSKSQVPWVLSEMWSSSLSLKTNSRRYPQVS